LNWFSLLFIGENEKQKNRKTKELEGFLDAYSLGKCVRIDVFYILHLPVF